MRRVPFLGRFGIGSRQIESLIEKKIGKAGSSIVYDLARNLNQQPDTQAQVVEENEALILCWRSSDCREESQYKAIAIYPQSKKEVGVRFTGITHEGVKWVEVLGIDYSPLRVRRGDKNGLKIALAMAKMRAMYYHKS